MKRYFTALLALAMGVCASAQITIKFSEAAAKGSLNGYTFESDGMELTVTDSNTDTSKRKISVESNSCRFGEPGKSDTYSFRLKTGGKSDSKNNLKLHVPEDGTLYIAVRSGSSDDVSRTVILTQDNVELFNAVVKDADAKVETYYKDNGDEATRNIFPYIKCDVKEGDVYITYPVNSVNFYAFVLESSVSTPIQTINADAIPAGKSIKTIENGKLVIIRDGVKYDVNGRKM